MTKPTLIEHERDTLIWMFMVAGAAKEKLAED